MQVHAPDSGLLAAVEGCPIPTAETLGPPSPSAAMTRYRIVRDDGLADDIAGRSFDSYAAAYAVLERYSRDLCCSDEREYYSIEAESAAGEPAEPETR